MRWDVVEVKPESGTSLFGHGRLESEELTGVLPPRDPEFFRRVFVDCRTVAWVGEIYGAPEAIYGEALWGLF